MSTSNLKVSVAALSLCVSAVAIYIHLPYVIAAGSGAIKAVPLAIFTVSAVIALASVAYFIKLAVSPQTEMEDKSSVPPSSNNLSLNLTISDSGSGNVNICTKNDNMLMGAGIPMSEKVRNWQIEEVGTPEDQTNTGRGQPTEDVIKEPVLAPKSPPPPPVLGTQTNTSASVPPPPPPPVLGAQTNASASVPPPSPPPPPSYGSGKKPSTNNVSKPAFGSLHDEFNTRLKSRGDAWQKNREDEIAKVEKKREEISERQHCGKGDASTNEIIEKMFATMKKIIPSSSGSDLSGLPDSNGWSSNGDEEQDKQSFAPAQADAPIGATSEIDSDEELVSFQPDNKKRSESPDSAYGSKSTSPSDFKSDAKNPQVPASLQEEPSVTEVNYVDQRYPSLSSLK